MNYFFKGVFKVFTANIPRQDDPIRANQIVSRHGIDVV